jgi:lipopolysaccharide biosynthesis regulator YciM
MSGICSAHRGYISSCKACNTFLDQDPAWLAKEALAKAAGKYVCKKCDFTYYKTVSACPKCNALRVISSTKNQKR